MSTFTRQRRDRILSDMYSHGHVVVSDLAEALSVSEATVRRDLRALAAENPIELTYGGATLVRSYDYSFRAKAARNVEAKRIIGKLAADMVADGDIVFLDAGTTCCEMVPYLRRKRGLTVIVNSARRALELDTPSVNVIAVGGQYRPDRMDTAGPLAINTFELLRGYVAFLGTDGLSMDFGLTAGDIETAHLTRAAARNARTSILLADHSKFASPSLFKIVDFDAVSRVITDTPPSREWLDFFASKDIALTLPSSADAELHGSGTATAKRSPFA